jgi:multidrug efflux pump subunit AcrA (membrane-fusion protein)
MVERISAEGTKLFEVDLELNNPGTLVADMEASATLHINGEDVYPYETGKLQYYQSSTISAKVGGTVERVNLRNYDSVSSGAVLMQLSGDDNDSAIYTVNTRIQSAQKSLEDAQKVMEVLNGTAPISGTVVSLSLEPGKEIASGTSVVTVSDTSTIVLDASIDERNIGFVKTGMDVSLDYQGEPFTGTVTSVSLTSTVNNGVATFPAVISIDNSEGTILAGSFVSYTLIANQSEDALYLPIQAVKSVETEDGTKNVVFVKSDTSPEDTVELLSTVDGVPETGYYPVVVNVGISDNQNIEILDGVSEGDEVFQQATTSESIGGIFY